MGCKRQRVEIFETPFKGAKVRVRCLKCNGAVNRWSKPAELDQPKTYGLARPKSEQTTVTHEAVVQCKDGCTMLVCEGWMEITVAIVCTK